MTKTKAIAILVGVVGSFLYAKAFFFPDWGWEEHNEAGWVAYETGDHTEVEKHFLAAFKEATNFPTDDPRLHRSLNNLADVYRIQGKYVDAEPLTRRILEMDEQALGPDHPNVAASLNNLANNYRIRGMYEEALPLYKRALAIWQNTLGPEDPMVAHIKEIYIDTLHKTGSAGEESLRKSSNDQQKALSDAHKPALRSVEEKLESPMKEIPHPNTTESP